MINEISLEALGLTEEDLIEKVVDRLVENLQSRIGFDDDGEFRSSSSFGNKLNQMVTDRLDQAVEDIGEKHLLPQVDAMIENLVLQKTNEWGEAKGEPVSFTEYLVKRANAYITEKVSYDGKSKSESGSYSWSGTQTRIAHMIDRHLHYSIETAMKEALSTANSSIVKGLEDTVKIKLTEVASKLKVQVKP